ncbi:MAG: TIGR02757 family protein [Candidatus Hydrogenedentes bacterium]|nr:TIGR02757 family protein [Candidatus Hydrogenedentota bacterium]
MEVQKYRLKKLLEYVYKQYHKRENAIHDPVHWVYNYEKIEDMEIVGFISALLAFGNAKAFNKKIEYILKLWRRPSEDIMNTTDREIKTYLSGFRHRFVDGEVVAKLLVGVRNFIKEYGSIGNGMRLHWEKIIKRDLRNLLVEFSKDIRGKADDKLNFIIPDPEKKGSCKRLLLYIRWMVRKDEIDLGCWDFISRKDLVIPLDTHIHQWALTLGLTSSKIANYGTALEITEGFKEISPSDPLKYDFSLCMAGMLGEKEKMLKKFGFQI